MNRFSNDSTLVQKVLQHVLEAHADPAESTDVTQQSLTEAIRSLRPFKPNPRDLSSLNAALLERQASDIACKAAWALYKDYVLNASGSRAVKQG